MVTLHELSPSELEILIAEFKKNYALDEAFGAVAYTVAVAEVQKYADVINGKYPNIRVRLEEATASNHIGEAVGFVLFVIARLQWLDGEVFSPNVLIAELGDLNIGRKISVDLYFYQDDQGNIGRFTRYIIKRELPEILAYLKTIAETGKPFPLNEEPSRISRDFFPFSPTAELIPFDEDEFLNPLTPFTWQGETVPNLYLYDHLPFVILAFESLPDNTVTDYGNWSIVDEEGEAVPKLVRGETYYLSRNPYI